MEKEEEVGRGCFEWKVCWKSSRVQGVDGFSLAELWGGPFLVGDAAVPPSLLPPVIDDSFLLVVLLEPLIDSSCTDLRWFPHRALILPAS